MIVPSRNAIMRSTAPPIIMERPAKPAASPATAAMAESVALTMLEMPPAMADAPLAPIPSACPRAWPPPARARSIRCSSA